MLLFKISGIKVNKSDGGGPNVITSDEAYSN